MDIYWSAMRLAVRFLEVRSGNPSKTEINFYLLRQQQGNRCRISLCLSGNQPRINRAIEPEGN